MEDLVSVGFIQAYVSEDIQKNRQKTEEKIIQLAQSGAQIICLQELYQTIYFPFEENEEHFELAESIQGESTRLFQKLSETYGITIIASLFEKRAKGLYHNTTIVTGLKNNELGIYRKMHIPDDPGFYEKYYFTPSDDGYKVFETPFGKIGVLICWDQWFPEAARITALKGADILFYPTAIGWESDSLDDLKKEEYEAWQTMMRSHAIANGVHVVAVNRVGLEQNTAFWGGSFVCNPFGKVLYQASHGSEEMHQQTINLSETEKYRRRWPFLRDRRIDSYPMIAERFLGDDV